jgi:hypothetical protein
MEGVPHEALKIEASCKDEMRVGQKNKLTYRWARKGSRPRAPERAAGAALVLPACNTEAMQLHLNEIATKISRGGRAILLLDQAGWHGAKAFKVPSNISLLQLPPRAPELNGQENIWQFHATELCRTEFSNPSTTSSITALCLEHAHRSAVENHVHRAAIGQPQVTQFEDWYKNYSMTGGTLLDALRKTRQTFSTRQVRALAAGIRTRRVSRCVV